MTEQQVSALEREKERLKAEVEALRAQSTAQLAEIAGLRGIIEMLKQRLAVLEKHGNKASKNSRNSHRPPSSDVPKSQKKQKGKV